MRPLFVFLLVLYVLSRIGLVLYVCNLAYKVYLQEPKHCNAEMFVSLNTELTKTRENLQVFKGKVKVIFFKCKLQRVSGL